MQTRAPRERLQNLAGAGHDGCLAGPLADIAAAAACIAMQCAAQRAGNADRFESGQPF